MRTPGFATTLSAFAILVSVPAAAEDSAGPAQPAQPAQEKPGEIIVHARLLHVRDLPAEDADVTAHLVAGRRAAILEEAGGWVRIAYALGDSRIEGWVHSKWVSRVAPDAGDPVGRSGTVTGDRVNLRGGPTTKETAVHVLTRGDRVLVLKNEGRWLKIAFGSEDPPVVGWVHANYVRLP